ncbi:uncharacterized protein K02A2.6-like [Ylistrum balloti]|uniref:uncharacterized protein K02A2.6-like n=1 Tax=Ylistrum balloti TaxID=509963 RepID=UPI00290597A7|nr:uncharacterized protein K02A2.6-like [Ylistrum balloti]
MSHVQFDQPCFDWDAKDLYQEYQRFKQHVDFVFKGPLSKADDKDKTGWIGMWIGRQGREVYKTFDWAEGEQDKPEVTLNKLEAYVRPRKNKRVARFRLKQRKQAEGESFDNFVKDVRLILMDCDYRDPDDILIDTIIDGVSNRKVQEKMFDQGQTITLDKALEIGRQFEMSQKQLKMIRGEEPVNSVGFKNKQKHKPVHSKPKVKVASKSEFAGKSKKFISGDKCTRCARDVTTGHKNGVCPAIGSTCNYCRGRDHWKVACRKRLKSELSHVNTLQNSAENNVTSDSYDTDTDELFQIYSHQCTDSGVDDKWLVDISIGCKTLKCRIDTGARCCILVKSEYDRIGVHGNVRNSTKVLKSYTNHKIRPLKTVTLPVTCKGKDVETDFEIVDLEQENVISGKVAEQLGLIERIANVNWEKQFDEFPEIIKTTGTLPGEYTIKVDPDVKGVVHPVRRQPASLKPQIIAKLKEMEEDGFIKRVDHPTEWVSSMVVSLRKNKVRICIDPSDLNKAIKREHHPMKTMDDALANIPNATVFSVLDAKSGFLQIKLEEKSSYLTTFNTPIGRFRWLRLPFGLKCSPEIFQRIMDEMLEGIEGAIAVMDDILVAGTDIQHHDRILREVVERASSYNLKLNFDKCRVRKTRVSYVGHILTDKGVEADPEKVRAITDMPAPCDKEGVRRFLGLVQYLAKFLPNLSQVDAPLRILLKSNIEFTWGPEQERSFKALKHLCTSSPVLAFYDVNKPVQIQCDASKDGLGAILIQNGQAIAFSSRSLTDTEQRYAQIEKELLSIVHAATKFHCYIFGKTVTVYNDHKPLEQIFRKPLLSAPMRLQRMLMRLQWYDLDVKYMPGKDLIVADALSRAYLPDNKTEINLKGVSSLDFVSVSKDKYVEIVQCTKAELQPLHEIIVDGWPDSRTETPTAVKPYWDSRDQLSISDGIIFKGMRIVIPPSLRSYMLDLIHESHLGIVKCKQRAREVMYWPGMSAEIEVMIQNCGKCAEIQNKQPAEPLKPSVTPDLPYSEVGSDLFHFEGKNYIILVDYYSKYVDVEELPDATASATIRAMKRVFACHGIPKLLRSDNGPNFTSADFKTFCADYGIEHITSSPHFQSSNGEAERAIQTVKRIWRKADDRYLALLDYRTTPLNGINLSPSQILMSRRPRNKLPAKREILEPSMNNRREIKRHFTEAKQKQKLYYNLHNKVKELSPLVKQEPVRMAPLPGTKLWKPATVIEHSVRPRSYIVKSNDQLYRRNRKHLRRSTDHANESLRYNITEESDHDFMNLDTSTQSKQSNLPPSELTVASPQKHSVIPKSEPSVVDIPVTRSGRRIKPPVKLDL